MIDFKKPWPGGLDFLFDQGAITDCLGPPGLAGVDGAGAALRVKGVFRVGRDWILLNRSGGECDVSEIAYRQGSRAEVIVPEGATADRDRLEAAILDCLKCAPLIFSPRAEERPAEREETPVVQAG